MYLHFGVYYVVIKIVFSLLDKYIYMYIMSYLLDAVGIIPKYIFSCNKQHLEF